MEQVFILILLLSPFAGFLINLFWGKKMNASLPGIIGTCAVGLSFIISLFFFTKILSSGESIKESFFTWVTFGNFSIGFDIILDQLSLLWLLIVTGIGALIHIYSTGYMKGDENIDRFFAYLNLFIFFMVLLVTAGNLGIMFIGWEGVGLCSYLLIGFWYKNQAYNDAAKKAFIMNRIGDLGFVVGLFILGYLFHSVDFADMKAQFGVTANPQNALLLGIAAFALFVGAMGKSAQIPLYTWLPDAMAGPTPVSALIHAATMVTAGIFMITRLNFLFIFTENVGLFIAIIGAVTALFAASIAVAQTDIKKVLAYSTVSQLGFMFIALGFGAYQIAVFHVLTHAFFKACLFLGAGSVIHGMSGDQDMRHMGGLKKYMKITYFTFLVSTLAIAGIPIFSGFFSKDEILLTAFEHNKIIWLIGILASLLTSFYMFRAFFLTFHKDFRGTEEQKHHLHESPSSMTMPLIVLGFLATFGGFIALPFGYNWLNHYLKPVIPSINLESHGASVSTVVVLMIVAVIIALLGLTIAIFKYLKKSEVPAEDDKIKGFANVLYNKYYIDEIYNSVFVKPIYGLANLFKGVVDTIISSIVSGFGKVVGLISIPMRSMQNGSVGMYLFVFVLGFCSLIIYLFLI